MFLSTGGACVAGGMRGRGHAWQGACVVGGMHGRGACIIWGCVWQGACMVGACMAGGMHGRGACVAGVCVWQGGMHGRYYEIQSMSRRYASYWNAFLLHLKQSFEMV